VKCAVCGPLIYRDVIKRHNISCAATGERSYCGRVIYPTPRRVLMDYQEMTPGAVPSRGFAITVATDPFFGRLR
jgi:hypothetical protein